MLKILNSFSCLCFFSQELAQNANDAGAEVLELCFSQKQYGRQSLIHEKMAEWQGVPHVENCGEVYSCHPPPPSPSLWTFRDA